jgi:hypothetical protein
VWIIDLRARAVVATVMGVGNDPDALRIVETEWRDVMGSIASPSPHWQGPSSRADEGGRR